MSKGTALNQGSQTKTAAGDSGPLTVTYSLYLDVQVDVTAITGALVLGVDEQLPSGDWANLWTSAAITGVGLVRHSIGPGCETPAFFGDTVRLTWSPVTSATFSAQVIAGGAA